MQSSGAVLNPSVSDCCMILDRGNILVNNAVLGGCVLSGSCAVSGCYAVFGVQIGSILSVLLDNLQMGLVVVLDILLSVLLVVLLGVLLKEKYLKLLVTTQNL